MPLAHKEWMAIARRAARACMFSLPVLPIAMSATEAFWKSLLAQQPCLLAARAL